MAWPAISLRIPMSVDVSTEENVSLRRNESLSIADNELMRRIQERDENAFECLFDRYHGLVRAIARKIVRNAEEAEDVVQEVFLNVFRHAITFNPAKGSPKTWISCLTYHESLKQLRFMKNGGEENGDIEQASIMTQAPSATDFWNMMLDFRRCLAVVLPELNSQQRRTMYLYFYEGWNLSRIADELGESLSNTRHLFYRGLSKFRREIVSRSLLAGYSKRDSVTSRAGVSS